MDNKTRYDFFCEKTPSGGKPVIVAWFITHAHGDHVELANNFLTVSRCLGMQPGYSFNAWIRNDAIQKREHYTANETVTIPC